MRNAFHYLKNLIFPVVFFGTVTGICAGVLITLYRACAAHVIGWSEEAYALLRKRPILIFAAVAVMAAAALLYSLLYRRYPNLQGGGIPSSIAALRGLTPVRWVCDIVGVFLLSLSTFFLGVPLGNEGPSVQMGTAVGRGCIRAAPKKHRAWQRYSMTGGACAGFTAATGAPVSGIMFALEDAHRRISPMIIVASFFSVVASGLTCSALSPALGLDTALFSVPALPVLGGWQMGIPVLVGLWIGLFSVLFLRGYEWILRAVRYLQRRIPVFVLLFAVLLLTLAAGLFSPDAVSTGHHLIVNLYRGEEGVLLLGAVLVIRAVLTLFANTGGLTGGLFLPIMALGACAAAIFGQGIAAFVPQGGAYYSVILTLGIAACISGMMKTPITAITFAVEALGCHENIIPVIIAATLAFTVTEIFRVESINERVVESRLHRLRRGAEPITAERAVRVGENSFAVGKEVRDILWPSGLTVLSVRGQSEDGESRGGALCAGDTLVVRYISYDEDATSAELAAIVGE